MKKWMAACLMIMLVLTAFSASAEMIIYTPQEHELLPVSGQSIAFQWEPQSVEMEMYIIDTDQNVLGYQTIEPGADGIRVPIDGMKEGQPYLLILMIGDDSVSAAFAIDMGGGKAGSVNWSAGPSGSGSGGSGYGMITFNTENVEGLAKKMIDFYNKIMEDRFSLAEGYSLSNSRGVYYVESEEGLLLNTVMLHLSNSNGYFPYTERYMKEYTDTVFEILASDYEQLDALGYLEDDEFEPFSNRFAQILDGTISGGFAVLPIEFYNDQGVSFMLFALTNENGNVLLDDNLYAHFCVMDSTGKLVSMLMTEQEEIAQLIEELGLDKEAVAQMLPKVMSLGFTQERLVAELTELIKAGNAQKDVQSSADSDFHAAARDRESAVGKSYARILWDRMNGVYDDVLDTLIQQKTDAELVPNVDWQMAMYKGILYEMLEQNTEGIGGTASVAAEYCKAIRSAYATANRTETVDAALSGIALPQDEAWASLLSLVMDNMGAQSDADLAVIACMIAEQTANEAVLRDLAAAAGEQSVLGSVCTGMIEETRAAFLELAKTFDTPVTKTLADTDAGKRIASLKSVTANSLALSDMNADRSAMAEVYAMYGVSKPIAAMEQSLDIGDRLIQLNLIREELRALVEAAYEGADGKAAVLYTATRLFLIAEERCLTATQSYFESVDSSWFANTFANEAVTNLKTGTAAVNASRDSVRETGRTLREQRSSGLNARLKESNAALGRTRQAIVNTRQSPLTMTHEPEKKGGTVCMIPKGEVVTVLEEGQWPLVEYDGKQGFVDGQYLL
ncbi:MAG: hypothetical protein ACI4WX_01880 [Aristaeellaceae bacterium]